MKKLAVLILLATFLLACSSQRKVTKTGWSKKPHNNFMKKSK